MFWYSYKKSGSKEYSTRIKHVFHSLTFARCLGKDENLGQHSQGASGRLKTSAEARDLANVNE